MSVVGVFSECAESLMTLDWEEQKRVLAALEILLKPSEDEKVEDTDGT